MYLDLANFPRAPPTGSLNTTNIEDIFLLADLLSMFLFSLFVMDYKMYIILTYEVVQIIYL